MWLGGCLFWVGLREEKFWFLFFIMDFFVLTFFFPLPRDSLSLYQFLFIFLPHLEACRILVPLPGVETMPPTVKAQSLNHRTTREVPQETCCSRSRQWYQPPCHPGHKTQMDKDAVWSLWRLLVEENLQPETLGSWDKTMSPATENHLSFENHLLICFWALVVTVLWWWVANDSLEKTLMLGKIEGRRRSRDGGWDGWMASPTRWMWTPEDGEGQGSLACCNPWGCKELDMT